MLPNPGTLFLLRTSTEFLIALYTGGLFRFNVEINGKNPSACFCLMIKKINKLTQGYQNILNKNHFHHILRLFDVYQIFLPPQVKRCTIITYKHGIYELAHELPNDLRLRILGN